MFNTLQGISETAVLEQQQFTSDNDAVPLKVQDSVGRHPSRVFLPGFGISQNRLQGPESHDA